MVRSASQSIKAVQSSSSGHCTPNERAMTPTKSQSRTQSRRASIAHSLHRAYGEVKQKGLCNAIPTRFVVVAVAALANTLSYIMRTNMSVTIVAMVNSGSSNNSAESCPVEILDNQTSSTQMEGEFNWDETMQGHILGSYYYGYIATNINGGQLAEMFSARWLCGIVTLISAMFTIVTPFVARWDVNALILLRVATGLCQGVLTPAIYSLLAYWIPRNERGLVLALIQVGGNLGAVVSTIISGYLCQYGFDGGWPSVFYIFGICGVICFVIWMLTIYDTPDQHPRILDDELLKIKLNVSVTTAGKATQNRKQVPWMAIMTSVPVWAISVAKFCGAWGNLMLMSKLPSYLKSVLHVSIQSNGYITSAVYVALSISLTGFGFFSDWIGQKKLMSDTLSRKVFETIALAGPAICLIVIPLVGCNLSVLVALLVIAMIIFGLNAGGDKPIVVDVAPDHSGTIYGITNAIASLPGILSPLVVGFLINMHGGIQGWNLVFYSAAGVYIFGAVFFLIFGTAKPQPWGVVQRTRRATFRASGANSRMTSRGPSRRATFLETPASRVSSGKSSRVPSRGPSRGPSRKATFVQSSNGSSKINSTASTPHPDRKVRDDPNVFTIDLDKAINKVQQQLGDRIECDAEGRLPPNTDIVDYDVYVDNFDDYDPEFDEDMDEEYIDEEEEEAQRLQYFRERRFSIFPIA